MLSLFHTEGFGRMSMEELAERSIKGFSREENWRGKEKKTYTYIHTDRQTDIHTHTYIHTHIHKYLNTYTYINTYIHT